jgi:hypothetical protein
MTARLFIWVRGNSFLLFLARGWAIEAVDERYWSVLMSRDDSEGTQSLMETS